LLEKKFPNGIANRLLASLAPEDYDLLRPHLEAVQLPYRHLLYPANKNIAFAHFLENGVASLVSTMRNGDASEIGTIGNEGFVGLPILLADKMAPTGVYMQVPGEGFRIEVDVFEEALAESASLRTAMSHYAHAFFNQVAQSAACNHHHSLDQRCARWLMMTYDRMDSNVFLLTHEFLAMMLGVRRAGVTVAARELQRRGIIRYKRGEITILELDDLRKRACECYAVTKRDFDRLLGSTGKQALHVSQLQAAN
jgi:CRP-like cAMP-binding protein